MFYVPSRENLLLRHLIHVNEGPLSKKSLKAIYREVMSASLALEHELLIAYLGTEGAYTHRAALNRFGHSVQYKSMDSIKDVFENVAKHRCDYGVVPIENSIEGAVTHTLDMFVDYDLKICSETSLPINHHLMVKNKRHKIKSIYSNPQVFGQCRHWLQTNYPGITLVNTDSTTAAAEIATRYSNSAAIASDVAAELYNLKILNSNIQDYASNMTRFLIIGHQLSQPTGQDKTSLLFSLKDETGILVDVLRAFKANKINLKKIESRPAKKNMWKYYFYIDLDGHVENANVRECLDILKNKAMHFKVLGSYPQEV